MQRLRNTLDKLICQCVTPFQQPCATQEICHAKQSCSDCKQCTCVHDCKLLFTFFTHNEAEKHMFNLTVKVKSSISCWSILHVRC